ncbi:Zn(II)2Cys6 transcription factor domain-containing protein [Aspergillus homomorphus CBS 101889]|uniref:Zn(2)-C6 fungal-type domain-containing protein n=1 Tax=Aspergillus homomorphus (strain CBS 101889) TaxID=1450537 RepID=A0A395I5C9_ASPHC|nr:hypothetical protein BO97DRAFT_441254 [Aspergillus homomorphus CBS 101889]RAL15290.1 hypothetical protein BO97DRAFT_441254 [Aspergillus homomorphus CBS 101889]
MFGTIRYDKNTDSREHVELQRADGIEARGYTPIACDRCRSRKLKCSGDKGGCGRCRTASVACTYRDVLSIKDSRRMSKRVCTSNNQLPTPSPRHASSRSQPQPLSTEVDQERPQSTSDSEPLNWLSSSSEEAFTESPNTWVSSFLPMQPTFSAMIDDHATRGHDISCGLSGVPESNDPSSTDVENIFDAVLDTETTYHHTNVPPQPARLNQNTQERRAGRASLPGGNLPSAVGTDQGIPSKCECLSDVARFLDDIGVESTEARADMLLVCVSRGMRICGEALRCSDCSVRGDNGMFLAVVLQQLVTLTRTASDKLLAWTRENRNCQGSAADIHSPTIWLDQYRIEMPDLKVPLIRHVALLHLFSLRDLLNGIKDKVRPNSLAGHLITDCESNIVDALQMVRDKASNAMPMASAF